MKLETLRDLYKEQLKDLYSAETQLIESMPKMSEHASNAQLKQALEMHFEETKQQQKRLEQIGKAMGEPLSGHFCKGMQGVIAEAQELLKDAKNADPDVLDAGIITSAQRVEHYEMAGYGTARAYAELLGEKEAEKLLQQSLDEEGNANKKLTHIALSAVDPAAAQA